MCFLMIVCIAVQRRGPEIWAHHTLEPIGEPVAKGFFGGQRDLLIGLVRFELLERLEGFCLAGVGFDGLTPFP